MYDIDMKNAHPTLLSWYCHENEINCEYLDYYIENREEMILEVMNSFNIEKYDATMMLLAIINGKVMDRNGTYPPLNFINYYNEMRGIIKKVVEINPDYFHIAKNNKNSGYNIYGTTINYVICELENSVLMAAYDYLVEIGIEVGCLVFDGLMEKCDRYFKNTLWVF